MQERFTNHSQALSEAIQDLDRVSHDLDDLFGTRSVKEGFLAIRADILLHLGHLAMVYHQWTTIRYLNNSEDLSVVFNDELDVASNRVDTSRAQLVDYIYTKVIELETFLKQIDEDAEKVDLILNMIANDKKSEDGIDNENISPIRIYTRSRQQQHLLFALEEIRSGILHPAVTILTNEVQALHKLLDIIAFEDENKQQFPLEEVARMIEVLSWGLESSSDKFEDIQNTTNEVYYNLKREIVDLKRIANKYSNFYS